MIVVIRQGCVDCCALCFVFKYYDTTICEPNIKLMTNIPGYGHLDVKVERFVRMQYKFIRKSDKCTLIQKNSFNKNSGNCCMAT